MYGKHQALITDKLVLVSRSGFTKPALKKANIRNIEALTIEEACATDWNLALQLEGRRVFQLFNIRFNCSVHINSRSEWLPVPLSSILILPNDKHISVGNIVASVLSDPTIKQVMLAHFDSTNEKEYHVVYNPPDGTFLQPTSNINGSLVKLSICLHLDFQATPVEFASGRFRDREIAYGQATESDNYLCIVMTKDENGEVEGILYDSNEFKRLLLIPVQQ